MTGLFEAFGKDPAPYFSGSRKVPDSLFRFRGAGSTFFEEEIERLFKNGEIYCAPIDGQNDPFDCKPILTESPLREVNQLLKSANKGRTTASPENLAKIQNRRERKEFAKRMRPGPVAARSIIDAKSKEYASFRDKACIACFTEVWDSILMWSHYTYSHSGICIKFEPREWKGPLPNTSPPQPVQYRDERTELTTIDFINLTRVSAFASEEILRSAKKCTDALLYEKSKEWSYEKEWRISARIQSRGYKWVDVLEPVGVIFGLNATAKTIETVRTHAPKHVEFSRIAMHDTEYRLVAVPLD